MYGGIILVTSWVLLVGAAPICRVDFPGNSTGELIVAKPQGPLAASLQPQTHIIDQHHGPFCWTLGDLINNVCMCV